METGERYQTRDHLLDAAEELFADGGIEQTTVRAITQRAGANLAAVNYYFGSKEGLVREVFARRIAPINDGRVRLLERALSKTTVKIRDVIHAFVSPAIEMLMANPEEGRNFVRLMGRMHMDPDPRHRSLATENFEEIVERFVGAMQLALPGLGREEIFWRFHLAVGTFAQAVSCGHMLEWFTDGECRMDDPDEITERVVTFIVGGFRAKSPRIGRRS
ncbi:MAG: TetR family transcriptional regulator [Thermoanaerobaculia bacterium]|nr:TetR family transcriptional regulator [Thermoanaerobaculia bacterium]